MVAHQITATSQAGQSATFTIPAVGIAGHEGYVYAALPTGQQSANAPQSFLINGQRAVMLTMRGAGSRDVNVVELPVPSLKHMLEREGGCWPLPTSPGRHNEL